MTLTEGKGGWQRHTRKFTLHFTMWLGLGKHLRWLVMLRQKVSMIRFRKWLGILCFKHDANSGLLTESCVILHSHFLSHCHLKLMQMALICKYIETQCTCKLPVWSQRIYLVNPDKMWVVVTCCWYLTIRGWEWEEPSQNLELMTHNSFQVTSRRVKKT